MIFIIIFLIHFKLHPGAAAVHPHLLKHSPFHVGTVESQIFLPHIPDAAAFFEENLSAKKPVIKTGAEIPFTRYFYKYQQPAASEELEAKFSELERSVSERVAKLFG